MSETESPKTNPAPLNPGRVGFVGLAGVPNVGKSTLVNRLVGQKISIVSDRPQTTRERVCGIYTDARMQAVMVDIPGILNPRDAFNKALMDAAALGLMGCDLVWHIRDARRAEDPADAPVRAMIRDSRKRVWLIWNKVDRVPSRMFPARADDLPYERVFGISAKTGRGVEPLLEALAGALPEGPLLYDPEQLSDRDLRFLSAELVREKLFRYLGDEIPYALATSTETFDEESQPGRLFIRVEILTEREAHKPIIIGEKGAMLKKIGQAARLEIERLVEQPVFLELWVKVRPRWRKDERQLKELGLKPPNSY